MRYSSWLTRLTSLCLSRPHRPAKRRRSRTTSGWTPLERLEDRSLQTAAVVATFTSGVLHIEGTAGKDTINVQQTNQQISVKGISILVNGQAKSSISASDVTRIEVNGGDGNDTISLTPGRGQQAILISTVLNGGVGNDSISGGDGNDFIQGGDGADSLSGNGGNDSLVGGIGNDNLNGGNNEDTLQGGQGNDTLSGGLGRDQADFSRATAGVTVNLVTGKGTGEGTDKLDTVEDLVGSDLGDTLTGNTSDNRLDGRSGNDVLADGQGNDVLAGGQGNDTLDGGVADDTLIGGDGNDILNDGEGNDQLIGGLGNDRYAFADVASYQVDEIVEAVGAGTDTLDFSRSLNSVRINLDLRFVDDDLVRQANRVIPQNDSFANFENILGTAGDDVIMGNAANNVIRGGGGNDDIDGRQGDDQLFGESGNDTLIGYAGNDQLQGGAGDDVFQFWNNSLDVGNDEILADPTTNGAGNLGVDTLDFELFGVFDDGIRIDLTKLGVFQQIHHDVAIKLSKQSRINNVIGTHFNDVMIGNDNPNRLIGTDGYDTIFGAGGNDTLLAGGHLDGGGGDDFLQDSVAGTDDVFVGGAGNDRLEGGIGNDTLQGGIGRDTLIGGLFDVTDRAFGFDPENQPNAVASDDRLEGGDGSDYLFGSGGSDDLIGGLGDDQYLFTSAIRVEDDQIVEAKDQGNDTIDFRWLSLGDYVAVDLRSTDTMGYDTNRFLQGSGVNIENVFGSPGNDTIVGNPLNNMINGGPGDDFLAGWSGDDCLVASDRASNLETGETNILAGEEGTDLLVRLGDGDTVSDGELLDSMDDPTGYGRDRRVESLLFDAPPMGGTVPSLVDSTFNYSRRPTLIVVTQGASDDGRTVYGWEKDIAHNLQAELTKAGSQTYCMVVQWDSLSPNDNGVDSVVNHIREFLDARTNKWNVVLIGHSRGGIFTNDVAQQLGTHAKINQLVDVLIDPTASISMGDSYPDVTPFNVNGSIVYDDGHQFLPLGAVRDSLPVRGADYRRISLPGYGYYDFGTHMAIASWYATTGFRNDLDLFLKSNSPSPNGGFARETVQNNKNGYEVVDAAPADRHERVVDIGIRKDPNGNILGKLSVLGVSGMNVALGPDGVLVSSGTSFGGGGSVSIGQGLGASFNSVGIGPLSVNGGIQISADEARVDLDAGPMRISLGTKGGSIDFGVKKVKFAVRNDLPAGTVILDSVGLLGETIRKTLVQGIVNSITAFTDSEIVKDMLGRLPTSKLARELGAVNLETMHQVLDRVGDTLGTLMNAVDSDTLERAVGQLTPGRISAVLSDLADQTLSKTVNFLKGHGLDDVLGRLSGQDLNVIVNRLRGDALSAVTSVMPALLNQVRDLGTLANVLNSATPQALGSLLGGLSPSKVGAVLQSLGDSTLAGAVGFLRDRGLSDILKPLSSSQLAPLVSRLSGENLATVLDRISDTQVTFVLGRLDNVAKAACLNRLSDARVGEVLTRLGTDSLNNIAGILGNSRLAIVLGGMGQSTLQSVTSQLSVDRLTELVPGLNNDTLNKTLSGLSNSQINQMLSKLDTNGLSRAVSHLGDDRLRSVLNTSGSDVVDSVRSVLPTDRVNSIGGALSQGPGGLIGALGGILRV